MQLNLPFDHAALQKTLSADFQYYSPNTKFMWLLVFGYFMLPHCTGPLAPVYRYHFILGTFIYGVFSVFASVSLLSAPTLSLNHFWYFPNVSIKLTCSSSHHIFLIKLIIIQSIYIRTWTRPDFALQKCQTVPKYIEKKVNREKFPKCVYRTEWVISPISVSCMCVYA